MVFSVVMYGCESWTIKKAEHQRIDAFQLWFWRKLLRVPWTARRSNQSILKEISPEYSLERLMLVSSTQWTWVWASSGSQAREAWRAVIRGVAKSQIRLSDWNEPIKKQKHLFTDKSPYSQIYSFLSSHVQMWEMDHKEGWAPKNWCFQMVVLQKTV